ncbi:hypothetical protein KSP39_PZI017954 [Platanthera zijinensis]|uniref:Uncharacterized protein n=1 Tax=Platanthera zijinensis TaxID=2320716 RepID=A0AAP0G053_9ASPA
MSIYLRCRDREISMGSKLLVRLEWETCSTFVPMRKLGCKEVGMNSSPEDVTERRRKLANLIGLGQKFVREKMKGKSKLL